MTEHEDGIIHVLVAEDEALIRDALGTLLALEPDIEVVASFERGDDAEAWLLAHHVDVAVLDNHLPGRKGIDIARRLVRARIATATIIVSGTALPSDLHRALEVPVLGCCTKGVSGEQLAQAIRTVHGGQRFIDADLAAAALTTRPNPLRATETAVLRLIAQGRSTDQIALALHLSPGTVRNYLSAAATKLDAQNRISAVRIAQQEGWI
jgi:two-component system response regulator DesR